MELTTISGPSFLEPSANTLCPICTNLADLPNGLIDAYFGEIRRNSLPGCQFCALIIELFWRYVEEELGYPKYVPFVDSDIFKFRIHLPTDGGKRVMVHVLAPKLGGSDPEVRRKWKSMTRELFLAGEEKEGQRLPWSRFPLAPPKSKPRKDWLDQMLEWLNSCSKEHGGRSCQLPYQTAPAWCPTRLLRIDEGGRKLQLIETNDLKVPYSALSYCWGSSQSNLTDLSNISARQRGSGFNCLPLVHREAIELTYACGLRFIWIDAICIIQGHAEDWERESLAMADVYSNAAFTISAACCADVNQSVFSYRNPVTKFRGDTYRGGRVSPDVLAYIPFGHEPLVGLFESDEKWPAFRRAWCYQERLLSRRAVHFAPGEMVFECSTQTTCECAYMNSQQNESAKWTFESPQRYDGPQPELVYFTFWHWAVILASGRILSHDTDRLVAVAGLAKRYDRQTRGTRLLGRYLAGIWEQDLTHGLSWSTQDDQLSRRPKNATAPSWSWASVMGEVIYDTFDKSLCKRHHANFEDVSLDLVTDDAFGQVKGGYLRLAGPVVECVVGPQGIQALTPTDNLDIKVTYHLDIGLDRPDTEVHTGSLLKAVCLWSFNSTNSKQTFAMLLKKGTEHVEVWQRVGLVFFHPGADTMEDMEKVMSWVDKLGKEKVTVV